MPTVLSIGTTHPRNVAGLGRDARVAADWDVVHVMAVAAVSAQDDRGVHALFALPAQIVRGQLGCLDPNGLSAVRVGALGTLENAAAAAEFLEYARVPIVFDPVMRASSGGSLYVDDALTAVRTFVQRVKPILTPNVDEAEQLTGLRIRQAGDLAQAGALLLDRGARAVLAKGGHLEGDPVDVLVTRERVEHYADARIARTMHGTGCTLAMALACELAVGRDVFDAAGGARAYVRANLARL